MRHIWSLIAGLVAAPLTWLLLATGQASSSAVIAGWVAAGRGWDTHDLIEPAAFLVVAAVLIGLVATLRISPVGPIVAGLLLISGYVATFIEPLAVRDVIPNDWVILDRPVPLHTPLDNGTLALLGLMLLMAAFSVQRWRTWPVAVASEAPADPDATGDLDGSDHPDDAGDLEAQAPLESDDREPATPRNLHAVSALDEDTQELTLVSPPASAPAPVQQPPAPRVTPVSAAPPVAAAPPRAAAPRKPSVPVTLASVAVPGPVVESPATKRAAAPQQPQPAPKPAPAPAPADPGRRPAPGRPAPTDPAGPVPEEPPVPSARRPESPWSEPPTGSGNRTKANG